MSTSVPSATIADTAASAAIAAAQAPTASSPENVRHSATVRELWRVLVPDALYEMQRQGMMQTLLPDERSGLAFALQEPPRKLFLEALPILESDSSQGEQFCQLWTLAIGHVLWQYSKWQPLSPAAKENITRTLEIIPPDTRQTCLDIISQPDAVRTRTRVDQIVVKERINKTSDQIRSDQIDVVKLVDQNGDQNSGTATAGAWPASYYQLSADDRAIADEALPMLPVKLAKYSIEPPPLWGMKCAISAAVKQNAEKNWQGITRMAAATAGLAAAMVKAGKVYHEPVEQPAAQYNARPQSQPASKPQKQAARLLMVCMKCRLLGDDCPDGAHRDKKHTDGSDVFRQINLWQQEYSGMDDAAAVAEYFYRHGNGTV